LEDATLRAGSAAGSRERENQFIERRSDILAFANADEFMS
jgi:hypothetical protein